MFIKIYLERTNKVINFDNQHQMNGFIYTLLDDKADKYHDSFSDYSVSSIQGGHISDDKKGLVFDGEPFIQVSSNNPEFLEEFSEKLTEAIDGHNKANFFGLHVTRFSGVFGFTNNDRYDIVRTMSPILLRDKNRKKITIKDSDWKERIEENCRMKLAHCGIEDKSFHIELREPDKMRTKMIWVDKVFNPCTEGTFVVYGKKTTREYLYSMGLGNSTGTGFGAVRVLKFDNGNYFE